MAPRNLRVRGALERSGFDYFITLRWDDTADPETSFTVEGRRWGSAQPFRVYGTTLADDTDIAFGTLSGELSFGPPVEFRVRAENAAGASPWSAPAVDVTPLLEGEDRVCPGEADADPAALCLQDGRFVVRVLWRSGQNGTSGEGTAIPFGISDEAWSRQVTVTRNRSGVRHRVVASGMQPVRP